MPIKGGKPTWTWPETVQDQWGYMNSLIPSDDQVTAFRSALGKVVRVCHVGVQDVDFDVVRTCGSVGKETASAKSADLDLVVMVTGLQPADLKKKVPKILDAIEKAMDQQYPDTRDKEWYRKFGIRYVISGMEIDILVGAPGVKPKDFLDVDDSEQRAFMSASVSHLNTRFLKRQHIIFHWLVRVLKDWRDSYSWASNCKPKSYLLEILLLHVLCQHNLGNKKVGAYNTLTCYWKMPKMLHDFFKLLASVEPYHPSQNYGKHNHPDVFVYFEPYYKLEDLPLDEDEPIFAQKQRKSKKIRKQGQSSWILSIQPTIYGLL